MRNEWSQLGVDIKAAAWSEEVKNEIAMLGAPKEKIAGVLSANDGWSMEVTMLDKKGRRAERRRQKQGALMQKNVQQTSFGGIIQGVGYQK